MTAIEFVQKKINPRIDEDYDLSLTGKQLFELLDEYAAMQPETTELKVVKYDPFPNIPEAIRFEVYITECCSYELIQLENFCPSCGRRIVR